MRYKLWLVTFRIWELTWGMHRPLILSKIFSLKHECFYHDFAPKHSSPTSAFSRTLSSYTAFPGPNLSAYCSAILALMFPPLSLFQLSHQPGCTHSTAANPSLRAELSVPYSSGALQLHSWLWAKATSFATVDPQGYSVLLCIHRVSSSPQGSGLTEERRRFHSSLFLLSRLQSHLAERASQFFPIDSWIFTELLLCTRHCSRYQNYIGGEKRRNNLPPLPLWSFHWWVEGDLNSRLGRGPGGCIRNSLQSAIKPYSSQRWSPGHVSLFSVSWLPLS